MIRIVLLPVIVFYMCSSCTSIPATKGHNSAEPEREIVNITGDLYRFRQVRHSGVFLVTGDGIIVVDPTNPEVSEWLKQQLVDRFDLPVKYVIYSHSHNDHAGGGDTFADTAVFVGHENMRKNLQRPHNDAPLLAREKLWDKNNDGAIQDDEIGGFAAHGAGPNGFTRLDTDQNGSLSRAEIWAGRFGGPTVRAPDITYKNRSTVTLGGKTVELHYTGKNHSDDMTVVYFPAEKAIYTVDFLTPNRPPRTVLDGGYLPDWVESLKQVEQLDFDVIVPGHESPGTKAHVSEQVRYLDDLYQAVSEGIAAGKTESELVESVLLEEYSHLIEYDFSRAGNVSGAYEILMSSPKR
jgi:glyoxylase-like metal-dependent hydrolase (beta-lactamase superfamily II)